MSTGRLSLLAAALFTVAFATEAEAVCTLPAPAVVWSYPADGDTNVPTNAMIWILTSRGRQPQQILLDGQPLSVSPRDFSFVPPAPLFPNSNHVITISPPVGPLIKIKFVTGSGPAERVAPDKPIIHWITPLATRPLSAKCQAILNSMGCFDQGEDTHLVVAVEGAPLLWLIERVALPGVPPELHPWPSECGLPEIFAANLDGHLCGRGLRLHAVEPTGMRSMSAPICLGRYLRSGATLPPGDPPPDAPDASVADADPTADAQYFPLLVSESASAAGGPDAGVAAAPATRTASGCSFSGQPDRAGALMLLAFAVALATRRRLLAAARQSR